MKNWKTSLAGLLTGLPTAIDALITAYNSGFFTDKTGIQLVMGIGFILLGLYTKDHNVTGGTTLNTPNESKVVKEATKVDNE